VGRALSALTVETVTAWEALDSRGTPTVACEVVLAGGGTGVVVVPSGASTGVHESYELRDGGERYGGRGVRRAVEHVAGELAASVRGLSADDQCAVDDALRAADGTAALERLGANAVLAVSIACAVAAADGRREPLYRSVVDGAGAPLLPLPMINVFSGGAHARGAIDVQDFLAVPVGAESFAQALEWVWRVRRAAAELLSEQGLQAALVADEGGLGPALPSNRAALEILTRAIVRSGLTPLDDVAVAVDVAAGQLLGEDGYRLASEGRTVGADELVAEVAAWAASFPLVSVEDPVGDDDWDGWARAGARLAGVQLLGDDLFATDLERVRRGIREGVASGVIVKPNQTGTLSSAQAVVEEARQAGYATVLSARSGDTEDSWLADLAVAWRTGQIKVGSTTRSERTAKWNRLLRIEAELGDDAEFAGRAALVRRSG